MFYLIFKSYKNEYSTRKPRILGYSNEHKSALALYDKYKNECIELKIIEAQDAESAQLIYAICTKQKFQQMVMEFE